MYVVQRRNSENCLWKTCSLRGKKCRYEYIADARTAYRKLKNMEENIKIKTMQFRIIDTEDNDREVD